MRAQFTFHPERCVGCGACVMACINENGINIDERLPYRLLKKNEYAAGEALSITWFVHGCMHCPQHPCVSACPKSCFSMDSTTGTVRLDPAGCVGCHRCERSCQYGAIQFVGRRAAKCNGCRERLLRDLPPLCVLACPRQALTIDEKNAVVTGGLDALRQELEVHSSRKEAEHEEAV